MVSEWARNSAKRLMDSFICDDVAAALDEAREDGAERERWECHRIASEVSKPEHYRTTTGIPSTAGADWITGAIAARGPMRGPEEEK